MFLETMLKILGWIFVGAPSIAFLSIGFYMIKGAMTDDETIKALVLLGAAIFFMGAILLLMLYLTDVFRQF